MFLEDDVREVKGRVRHASSAWKKEEYVRKKQRVFAGVLKEAAN